MGALLLILTFMTWGFWQNGILPLWPAIVTTVIVSLHTLVKVANDD